MISAGALGLDLGELAFGGPAAPVATTIGGDLLGSVFHGGAATDAARMTRAQWTAKQAQYSITAAEIIIAAPRYVSGNEAPDWVQALAQVPPNMVQAAYAQAPGGWWPDGQPDFYTDVTGPTHQKIVAEVAAGQAAAGVPVTPAGIPVAGTIPPGTAATTPAVRLVGPTSSSSNTMYWVLGGIAVVVIAALFFATRRRGGG